MFANGVRFSVTTDGQFQVGAAIAGHTSEKLTVNGNGNFAVNWDPNLVGKTRQLGLVE